MCCAIAAVDDKRLLGAEASGGAGRVHRGVAAAVNDHTAAEDGFAAAADLAQHRDRVENLGGLAGRDLGVLRDVGADGDEHGVEAAVLLFRFDVGHRVIQHDPDTEPLDSGDLGGQFRPRQTIGRDAELQHTAGDRTGLVDFDLMAEPGQMISGGQAGGTSADDQDSLAGGRGRGG